MSAPDPKLWEEPDDDPEVLAFAYGIARRRALAELKALVDECEQDAIQDHDTSDGLCEAVHIILRRIAEIEAEG